MANRIKAQITVTTTIHVTDESSLDFNALVSERDVVVGGVSEGRI